MAPRHRNLYSCVNAIRGLEISFRRGAEISTRVRVRSPAPLHALAAASASINPQFVLNISRLCFRR